MEEFFILLTIMKILDNQEDADIIAAHPLYSVLSKTEEIYADLKFTSFRKLHRLYDIGLNGGKTVRKRDDPDLVKGLFS